MRERTYEKFNVWGGLCLLLAALSACGAEEVAPTDTEPPAQEQEQPPIPEDEAPRWPENTSECPFTPEAEATIARIREDGFLVREFIVNCHANYTMSHLDLSGTWSQEEIIRSKFSILADGRIVTIEEATEIFLAEHHRQWGAMSIDSVRQHLAGNAEGTLTFDIYYRLYGEIPTPTIQEALLAVDPEAEIHDNVRSQDGFAIFHADWDTVMERLAYHPQIRLLGFQYKTWEDYSTWSAATENAGVYTQSDVRFTSQGIYGLTAIALDEPINKGCGIYEGHEAFSNTTSILYMEPQLKTCSTDKDCLDASGSIPPHCGGPRGVRCMAGKCVSRHATQVSSAISSSVAGQPFHAAAATLYVANDNSGPGSLARFSDFRNKQIEFVNISYGSATSYDQSQQLIDAFSRGTNVDRSMTVVQAAGNVGVNPANNCSPLESTSDKVTCQSLNGLCVGGAYNSPSHGDFYTDDKFSSWSRWRNPDHGAEKPDVLAEAMWPTVARLQSATSWWTNPGSNPSAHYCQGQEQTPSVDQGYLLGSYFNTRQPHGTSFAAPAVSGLLALLEQCRVINQRPVLTSASSRAIIRTSAVPANGLSVAGPLALTTAPGANAFYPTPEIFDDAWGGTGVASAHYLPIFCQNVTRQDHGDWITSSEDGESSNQAANWTAAPANVANTSEADAKDATKDSATLRTNASHAVWKAPLKLGSDAQQYIFKQYSNLEQGDRLRVSLSFYACGDSTAKPGVDFDLVAYDQDNKIVAYSGAVADTNEGFDVRLDRDVQTLTLAVLRANNASSRCTDILGQGNVERFAWAILLWEQD